MNTNRSLLPLLLVTITGSLLGCGGGTAVEDAGLDAFVETLDAPPVLFDGEPLSLDAVSVLDASSATDAPSAEDAASSDDAGSILPTYDGGDPFDDDGGLGDPAWVELDVITDGTACPALDACGGDVEGTWDVTGGCFELPIEAELSRCPGAAVTRRDGRARGRVTFEGGFARRVAQSEVVVEMFVPALCADFVGGCDAIEGLVRMATADSECVTEASGACRCAARQVYAIDDADGYTTESGQIVSASLGRRWDYCIDGTSLRYEDVTPGSTMREPGIIELGRR